MRKSLLFSVAFGMSVFAGSSVVFGEAISGRKLEMTKQNMVRGVVSDASGPLRGVTVSVVGGDEVTSTDENGRFVIEAANGATLRFSFLGYQPKDVPVSGSNLSVLLEADDTTLEDQKGTRLNSSHVQVADAVCC